MKKWGMIRNGKETTNTISCGNMAAHVPSFRGFARKTDVEKRFQTQ